jgi:HPt (histidine-containing phosphotransfer) domain-containing protein
MADFEALENLMGGDVESLREVFKAFLDEVPKNLIGIRIDCEKKDWLAAQKKVHQIKPFYGYAGDVATEQLAEEWQHELEGATDTYRYQTKLAQLEESTRVIIESVKNRLGI